MSDLPIQIVDESDTPIHAGTKEEAWRDGLVHRVARVMVEDGEGNLLLQKRLDTKSLYPGCWDNSGAGHVDAGETYEIAAARELAEEVGIQGYALTELDYYRSNGSFNGKQLNRFSKLYKTTVPHNTPLKIKLDEVSEARWFTIADCIDLVHEHPEIVTDGLIEAVERYYTRVGN